ncbi:MAG: helix-turn-helix domain-containing protein, partial [Oligoflexia bacterium]|nr:helix-turn-helix domain-containing protein [Oligoflexia bacterium]
PGNMNIPAIKTQNYCFLDIDGLSEFINIKKSMIRSLVFQKQIPFIKIKKLLRFNKDDILAWINKNKICE